MPDAPPELPPPEPRVPWRSCLIAIALFLAAVFILAQVVETLLAPEL